MSLKLQKLPSFPGRPGPLLLIIMDGIGLAADSAGNAVTRAHTPCLDRLQQHCRLQTTLTAHGPAVGMPSWSDMGNSEVGHNALGAGRIVDQGASLVNKALASGELFRTDTWQEVAAAGKCGGTLHFIGLLSDGNVHSHIDHLFAMLRHAAAEGVQRIALHLLLDGRDVQPRSALGYLAKTESLLAELQQRYSCDVCIASGGGRMQVTMDRYNADWQIVARGWQAHVLGQARTFRSAEQAVETFYRERPSIIDQDLEAFVIVDSVGKPLAPIVDGDAVIFFNFRGDRAIEISRAFEEQEFHEFDRQRRPQVIYCGMMRYDGDLLIPKRYLVSPPLIQDTVSEYLCAAGLRSFAISETQKYGHVTYFWNGNRSGKVDAKLEEYVEIPSDRVPFNEKPQMQAAEITTATRELLKRGEFRFGRVNFANGDMVGHTGDFEAAVKAVEAVDRAVDLLEKEVAAMHGITLILADHGNCEKMFVESHGKRSIKTSHTLNPVPCFICDADYQGEYVMAQLGERGLGNVAATLLNLLGYEKPQAYEPSLLRFLTT